VTPPFDVEKEARKLNAWGYLSLQNIVDFGHRCADEALKKAIKPIKKFSWILPVYKTKELNDLTDDVACEVAKQIYNEILSGIKKEEKKLRERKTRKGSEGEK